MRSTRADDAQQIRMSDLYLRLPRTVSRVLMHRGVLGRTETRTRDQTLSKMVFLLEDCGSYMKRRSWQAAMTMTHKTAR